MFNIKTGLGGITKRENQDLVIFVSSLQRLREPGWPLVFTNQHACALGTDYYSDLVDLKHVDWPLLQSRNFKTDDADPGKQLRYQAEALVHRHVPLPALPGVGCFNDAVKQQPEAIFITASRQKIGVKKTPAWCF